MQPGKRLAEQLFRGITEHAGETFVHKAKITTARNDGQQLAGERKQRSGLRFRGVDRAVWHQTLGHSPVTTAKAISRTSEAN